MQAPPLSNQLRLASGQTPGDHFSGGDGYDRFVVTVSSMEVRYAVLAAVDEDDRESNVEHVRAAGGHALDKARFAEIVDWIVRQAPR